MGICIKTKDGEITFGVDRWANRKSPVLYLQIGSHAYPLAYFRNGWAADQFNEVLNLLCEVMEITTVLPRAMQRLRDKELKNDR